MPGINYTLGMQTAGFQSAINNAFSGLGKLTGAIGKIAAPVAALAGIGSIGLAFKKAISEAAGLEDLEATFAPLLGSFQAAEDRIAELNRFAAATPFELPGIAAASITLQTLTKGALATGDALTLIGDVASGAFKGDFEAAAGTLGELYDALHNGGDIGDLTKRLQQVGAISGDVRKELTQLHAEGGKGAEAWKKTTDALSTFSGMMAIKSQTWTGLMSTFRGSINMAFAALGKPIIESLKPFLDSMIAKADKLKAAFAAAGEKIGNAVLLMQAAFKSGNMFSAAGAALKLGFIQATNTLATNLQAAIAASLEAFKISGVLLAVDATFSAITLRLTAALQSATADFMEGIGRHGVAKDMRDRSAEASTASGSAMSIAKQALGTFSPETVFFSFQKKFQEQIASLPPLIDETAARKDFDDLMKPIQDIAEDMKEGRRKLREELEKTIKPIQGMIDRATSATSGTSATEKAAAASHGSVDRLRQIGGYVGGGISASKDRIAERTEQWTRKTAEGVIKLANRPWPTPTTAGVFS